MMPFGDLCKFMTHFCILLALYAVVVVRCYPQEDSSEDGTDPEDENLLTTVSEVADADTTSDGVSQETTLSPPVVCDAGLLTSCFINVLDDWAWNIYTFKDNIATINDSVCEHHKQLAKCVDFPDCTRQEVLNVSSSVSDLLLHRTDSGTFLKSFFLNSYTCTEEGLEMVSRNRECLMRNHLNQEITKISTQVENEFRVMLKKQFTESKRESGAEDAADEDAPDYAIWYCNHLSSNLGKLYLTVVEECKLEAAYLTCKSLTDAFLNIFPDSLLECKIPCAVKPTTTASPPTTATAIDGSDVIEQPGVDVGHPTTDDETKSKDAESGSKSEQNNTPTDRSCTIFSVSLFWLITTSICSIFVKSLTIS